jgi:hypothetical protein
VRVYTSRWSTVEEGQANTLGRTIRVRLSAHGREIIGVLTVADPGGTLSERKIVGPTCPGVARALAIMVGVAIEPHGALETTQDEDHEPATGPSGLAESERSAESAEHAPPENSRTTDRARSSTDRAVEHRASTSRTNWRHGDGVDRPRAPETSASSREPAASSDDARRGFLLHVEAVSVDLRGESTSAVIGGSLPGLAASIAFALQIVDGPRWTRRLRPSVGLGIRRSFPKERSLRGGNVDFEWTAGSLRLCPHTFVAAGVVELSPCVETNVGSLRASADGYADAQRTSVPWLDLGGAMWAAVSLSKHLFLSSTVLVSAPLLRRPFVLASGARPAEIPVLGVLGGLGLGARW